MSPTTSVTPSMQYTIDEENWLQGKLQIFDECWRKVHIGEDLVSEFVMFNYDVPLSKSFVANHLAIFNERYRLMMKMHYEFMDLSSFEQEKLWKRNILYGTAMNLVKLESCKTGREQWHFVYPPELNNTLMGQMILKNKNIKKVDMDICNEFSGIKRVYNIFLKTRTGLYLSLWELEVQTHIRDR